MPDVSTLLVFSSAVFVLLVVPGPAVTYIVARSLEQGRAAGFASILGLGVGTIIHVVLLVLGLSAVLESSAAAFTVIRFAGAAYLVYLGLRRLLSRRPAELPGVERGSLGRIFRQGIVVNVLNPKAILFVFALLPQFVDPARGSVPVQLGILGAILLVLGLTTDSAYALAAGTLGDWLRGRPRFFAWQERLSGAILLVLGVAAAFSGPARK